MSRMTATPSRWGASRAQPARLGLSAATSREPPHCHNIVKADTTPPTTVALTRQDLDSR
jgi:hypothetical protein